MTITAIDSARTSTRSARRPENSPEHSAAQQPSSPAHLSVVPTSTEARGFALYVGLDEFTAAANGVSLPSIVEALRATLAHLAPHAESYATVALAPRGAGGRDVEIVRQALKDPAFAAQRAREEQLDRGVVVDLSRNTVSIDGAVIALTYKELRLLQHLIVNEGRTVERAELIANLWSNDDQDVPNERTIDVHIRRLRSKLGAFEGIIRTVRGIGYRYDHHADVHVLRAA
ncbi:MAG TPA: winged helix-turn-helix transcriptional regulator [Pseudoclavibacter sp.]|nr:winged helix-turn-helix transcriptional regulator [Pseudoclavibacter sp.]